MNNRNKELVLKAAEKYCEYVQIMGIEDDDNRYALSIDGKIFYDADDFFTKYPRAHTPYCIKKSEGGWMVVKVHSVDRDEYRNLDQSKIHPEKKEAMQQCQQLNDEWHKHNDEAFYVEL